MFDNRGWGILASLIPRPIRTSPHLSTISLTALVVSLRFAVLEEDPVRFRSVEQGLGKDGFHGGGGGIVVVVIPVAVVVRPVTHVVDVRGHSVFWSSGEIRWIFPPFTFFCQFITFKETQDCNFSADISLHHTDGRPCRRSARAAPPS